MSTHGEFRIKFPCPAIGIINSVSTVGQRGRDQFEPPKMEVKVMLFVFFVLLQGLYSFEIISRARSEEEPPYTEHAKMARYIVHKVGEW